VRCSTVTRAIFFHAARCLARRPARFARCGTHARALSRRGPGLHPARTSVWLDAELPDGRPLQRLAFAQDTGGAIKGAVRADLFLGQGAEAGRLAGEMKQRGRLYVLLPKSPAPATALSLR